MTNKKAYLKKRQPMAMSLVKQFNPQVSFVQSKLTINNYPALLRIAQKIDMHYSSLNVDPKKARQIRTRLNRLLKRMRHLRISRKKSYMEPYEYFKNSVSILSQYISSPVQHFTDIIDRDRKARHDQLVKHLKVLTRKICRNYSAPLIPVPPEVIKMSMPKQKRLKIIAFGAKQAKKEAQQKAIRPVGKHMVDTSTGEIKDRQVGNVIRHLTFHGTRAQFKQLIDLLHEADLPISIDKHEHHQ